MASVSNVGHSLKVVLLLGAASRVVEQTVPVRRGMSLHDFISQAIQQWREPLMQGLRDCLRRPGDAKKVAIDPFLFSVAAGGVTITTKIWAEVFAVGAAPSSTLSLDLTPSAQLQFTGQVQVPRKPPRQIGVTRGAIPTPATFKAAGKHFKGRLLYCLQELVANAVDATRRTGCERRITIGLHHNKGTTDPGKRYAMTIHDNGRGMSEKDLDQCVTYALSQDARGLNTERLFKTKDSPKFVDSEISRFGVGMLDAAFAAGESVYVMTKRRQAVEVQQVAIELDKVWEKYREDAATAYDFPKVTRDVKGTFNGSALGQLPERLAQFQSIVNMIKDEQISESFTTLVIGELDGGMAKQFLDEDIADKLGHAYHYFAQSEDQPSSPEHQVGRVLRGRGSAESNVETTAEIAASFPLPQCLTAFDTDSGRPEKPVRIFVRDYTIPNLEEDAPSYLEEDAFNLPDKNLEQKFEARQKNERWYWVRMVADTDTGREDNPGISLKHLTWKKLESEKESIYALAKQVYLPAVDFSETHPQAKAVDKDGHTVVLPKAQLECRWQGQPLFELNQVAKAMPFASLQGRQAKGRYGKHILPDQCFKRHRTTLYFSGHMPVGNNKLELNVKDFEEMLNEADYSPYMTRDGIATAGNKLMSYEAWEKAGGWNDVWKRKGKDDQPKTDFLKWLLECHQTYDKDIDFHEENVVGEELKEKLAADDRNKDFFKQATMSRGRVLRVGDRFRFKKVAKSKFTYARAVALCKDSDMEHSSTSPLVYYQQLPEELYPKLDKSEIAMLAVRDELEFSLIKKNKDVSECEKHSKDQLANYLPKRIQLLLMGAAQVQRPGAVLNVCATDQSGCTLEVSVVNSKGKKIEGKDPALKHICNPKIKITSTDKDGESSTHGPIKNGARFSAYIRTGVDQKGKAGTHKLKFECILDGGSEDFTFEMPVREETMVVKPGAPTRFQVTNDFSAKEADGSDAKLTFQLGTPEPDTITIQLFDRCSNVVPTTPEILSQLELRCEAYLDADDIDPGLYHMEQRFKMSSAKPTDNELTSADVDMQWKWPSGRLWEEPLPAEANQPAHFKLTARLMNKTTEPYTYLQSNEPLKKKAEAKVLEMLVKPRLAVTGEIIVDSKSLQADDDLPDLTVRFVDEFDRPTQHDVDASIQVEVSVPGLKRQQLFCGCRPIDMSKVNHEWKSYCRNPKFVALFKDKHILPNAKLRVKSTGLSSKSAVVEIKRSTLPKSALVLRSLDRDSAGSMTVRSGEATDVTDLIVELKDAWGQALPWGRVIDVHWNKRSLNKFGDGKLPPLTAALQRISSNIGGTLTIDDGSFLDLSFDVIVTAGRPTAWILSGLGDVCVGESGQFKDVKIFAVDDQETKTQPDNGLAPIITLEDQVDGLTLHNVVPVLKRGKGVPYFVLPNNARLDAILANVQGNRITITVSDARTDITVSGAMKECSAQIKVKPGTADSIRMQTGAMELLHPRKLHLSATQQQHGSYRYTADVPGTVQLNDLIYTFMDKCGNPVMLSQDRNISLTCTGDVDTDACANKLKARSKGGSKGGGLFPSIRLQARLNTGSRTYELTVQSDSLKSIITCNVQPSNRLVSMKVETPVVGFAVEASTEYSIPLAVTLATEDGEEFTPSKTMFSVTLTNIDTKDDITCAHAQMEVRSLGANVDRWVDANSGDNSEYQLTKSGRYRLDCQVTETRDDVEPFDDFFTHQFNVVAANLHSLVLIVPGRGLAEAPEQQAVVVSNGPERDDRRLFHSGTTVCGQDVYGNEVQLSKSVEVSLRAGTSAELPRLEGADTHGILRLDTGSPIDVGILVLAENQGAAGDYYLDFKSAPARPLSIQVTLSDGAEKANLTKSLQETKKQLNKLESDVRNAEEELQKKTEAFSSTQQTAKDTLDKIKRADFASACRFWGQQDVAKMETELQLDRFMSIPDKSRAKQQIQDMVNPQSARDMRIAMHAPDRSVLLARNPKNPGVALIQVGYVENLAVAQVLSWRARNRLSGKIVETLKEQKALEKLGVASFALCSIRRFERSDEDRLAGKLPLSLPLLAEELTQKLADMLQRKQLPDGPKLPQFAVNLIELLPENEHLRQTVFYKVYGQMLLMPTVDIAKLYLKECTAKNKPCPAMVTMDGRFVCGDSWSDPNDRLEPAQLKFVYGAMKRERRKTQPLYVALEALVTSLGELERLQQQHHTANEARDKAIKDKEQNTPQLEQQKAGIEDKLKALDSNHKRKARAFTSDDDTVPAAQRAKRGSR